MGDGGAKGSSATGDGGQEAVWPTPHDYDGVLWFFSDAFNSATINPVVSEE